MTKPVIPRRKYGAIKTHCAAGHLHDSKMEAGRCDDLHVLQAAGRIERLTQQPVFNCSVNGRKICDYKADFAYFLVSTVPGESCRVCEDVKGFRTPTFNLKKKLVEAIHAGVVITLWPPVKKKQRKKKPPP